MDLPATTELAANKLNRTVTSPYRHFGVWLSCIGIILLFIALRWNNFNAPLIRDEGEYFYSAILLKQGIVPYVNSFLQKPPMIVYTYALASTLLPNSWWSARLLAYLFVALTTILLGIIARVEFGPGIALTAMWLFTLMVLQPGMEQFYANTEMFLILPLLATLALFAWRRKHGGGGAMTWFAAGFFAATTCWYKYTAFPLLALIFCFWTFCKLRTGDKAALIRNWASCVLGTLISSAAVMAFFWIKGGLKEFWECTVVYNRFYTASGNFSFQGLLYQIGRMEGWWILFLLPLYFFSPPGRSEKRIWFWMALFFVGWLSTAMSIYSQYYILVMPFWAVLCAVGINRLCTWLTGQLRWNATITRYAVTAAVVLLVCLPDIEWMMRTSQEFDSEKVVIYTNPFRESETAAIKVAQMTSPNDLVFIGGSEPQILVYARRRSVTRFIIAYPLMAPTPMAAAYQAEAIQELEKTQPKVIVLAHSNQSWLAQKGTLTQFPAYLHQLLEKHYELVGGSIADGKEWHWQDTISPEEMSHATLILLRRKPG
jgi:4-amino-4-deoxy-L-arabinose transferase-like glycosyltransferase